MDVGLSPQLRNYRTPADRRAQEQHRARLLRAYAGIVGVEKNPIKAARIFRNMRACGAFRGYQ